MKRIAILFVALSLLSACGRKKTDPNKPEAKTDGSATKEPEPEPVKPMGGGW
jgi:hypothetical protein